MARIHVDNLFHLDICSNSLSSEFRFWGVAIINLYSSSMDHDAKRNLLKLNVLSE